MRHIVHSTAELKSCEHMSNIPSASDLMTFQDKNVKKAQKIQTGLTMSFHSAPFPLVFLCKAEVEKESFYH